VGDRGGDPKGLHEIIGSDLAEQAAGATERLTHKSLADWESLWLRRIRASIGTRRLTPGFPFTTDEMHEMCRYYGLDDGDMYAVKMRLEDILRKRRDFYVPECKTSGRVATGDVLVWVLNPERFAYSLTY